MKDINDEMGLLSLTLKSFLLALIMRSSLSFYPSDFIIERHLQRDQAVAYYVSDQFHQQYNQGTAAGRKRLREIEKQVEHSFLERLQQDCQLQRQKRSADIRRAQWRSGPDAVAKARAQPAPSCERLNNYLQRNRS